MPKRFVNSGTWIDDVTGEKYHSKTGGKFYDDEDLFYAQERREQERKKQYRYTQTDELGKYILLRVKKLPTNLDPATLARLTLLSTYIDYKNRLMINKHTVMEKSDLPEYEGVYHFTNEGACTWYDFAKEIAALSNHTCDIQPCHSNEFPSKVKRPHFSVLDKSKVKETFNITIPHWKDSLIKCINELEA